jgi:hypothetical protein
LHVERVEDETRGETAELRAVKNRGKPRANRKAGTRQRDQKTSLPCEESYWEMQSTADTSSEEAWLATDDLSPTTTQSKPSKSEQLHLRGLDEESKLFALKSQKPEEDGSRPG